MNSVLDAEEDASQLKFGKVGAQLFTSTDEKYLGDSPYLTNEELYGILLRNPVNTSEYVSVLNCISLY